MTKYHITKKGVPGICHAKNGTCPLGGASGTENHFDSIQSAQAYADKVNQEKFLDKTPAEISQNNIEEAMEKLKGKNSPEEEDKLRNEISDEKTNLNNGQSVVNKSLDDVFDNVSEPDGGATFKPNGDQPVTGFCASPYPEYSKVFNSSDELNKQAIDDYVDDINKQNPGLMDDENTYIGLWNDPQDGKIYVDVSKHYMNAEDARKTCEEHDQIAFFDLNTFDSVTVNLDAKSGQ